jgi:ABC-2 type transport system permease protein
MTTLVRRATALSATTPSRSPTFRDRFALSWRLTRRSAALMWLSLATYMAVEVMSFRSAYPDAASRQKLLELSESSAVRMLQGVPGNADTAGGFAVWDAGWMILLIVAVWSALTITRLTRGEEDSGRAELAFSRPVTTAQSLVAGLSAMAIGLAGMAGAVALPLVVLGEPVAGALLWGAGLAGFGAVVTTVGAAVAQLVEPRRRAASVALGLVAVAFLLRVVANSADDRAWVLTTTPFGWVDRLHAFSRDRWWWLAAPVVATLLLVPTALALSGHRDTGAALVRSRATRRSSVHLLGSATAFGWRMTTGALLAWAATLAVTSLVFGLMTGALVDFIKEDESYRRMLESMGVDMAVPLVGFTSYLAESLALAFASFAGWRLGATRQEEADGHLDNLLPRGVVRWRWLAVTAVLAYVAASVLVLVSGAGLWAGAWLVDAPVTVSQVAEPMAGTLPLAALFTGLAVLTFGVAPRLTVGVPVTLAVVGYLLDTFGTLLEWPDWLLSASPFHHLARLPGAPMTLTSVLVMSAIGVVAAAAGVMAFARRDIRGA